MPEVQVGSVPGEAGWLAFTGDPLEGARFRVVVATIVINVVGVGLLVFAPSSRTNPAAAR